MLGGQDSLLYKDTPNIILLGDNKTHAYSAGTEDHPNDNYIVYDADTMLSTALICEDIHNQRHQIFNALMLYTSFLFQNF